MTESKTKLVCITGIDGSGKSTLLKELKETIPNARVVTIWDMMKNPDFAKVSLFREAKDVDEYLHLIRPPARTFFLFHCMSEAIRSALKERPKLILIDAYWYKYGASEIASGADYEFVQKLGEGFPKPDLVFFLNLDSTDALARKGKYSGYECGYHPSREPSGFVQFQGSSFKVLTQMMSAIGAETLDGKKSVSDNLQQVLTRMREKGFIK